jgi:FkbM family methyltransferase
MEQKYCSDLIFDVGAHKGEDSDFYLKMGYRVIAIEANPINAQHLRNRFGADIRNGNYTVVERAIGKSEAAMTFYINKKNSFWGTANPGWSSYKGLEPESEKIVVQGTRFLKVLEEHGCPYYLKIDVEGADMLCVEALKDVDCRPKYISIESTSTSWSELLNEFDTLERLGYTRFKVVDQRTHKGGAFKDRFGKVVEYNTFEVSATGPFGEALEGVWLTKKQAIRKYIKIFLMYKAIGHNTVLRKILRRIPIARRVLNFLSWYDTHAMRDC